MEETNRLILHVVPDEDSDAEELAALGVRLYAELRELDLASVAPMPDEDLPPGAKGVGQVVGWLVAQFATPDGLRSIVDGVRSWAARNRRTVELTMDGDTLKLGAATAQQQQELIDGWLARHGPGA